jgi:Fic family protein
VPINAESEEIKNAVRKPLHERNPVGYNRSFLDDYRPNDSFYLSQKTREHLSNIGQSPDSNLPAGTYVRNIFNRLLIDLTWNSSRLEGNTYSLLETDRLLDLSIAADGKDAIETQMILNHKVAIELLVEQYDDITFNRYTILSFHALLSDNLLADPEACGRLRTNLIGIGKSVYLPLAVPQIIKECFQQFLDTVTNISDPFEQSFFAMVHLPYLQPFEDVNKRVSRIAANLPLVKNNLSPLSFIDVPKQAYIEGLLGIYELNKIDLLRDVFIWAYERSCKRYSAVQQSLGEPDPFRLQFRELIGQVVTEIVLTQKNKIDAAIFIKMQASENVPTAEQARFIEVVETEVLSLHEGNIARYRLRPSEYQIWNKKWK